MKKFFGLFLALLLFATSFAATNVLAPKNPSKLNANQVLIPIGKNGEKVSLMDLSRMKIKDLEAITGTKMKLADKIGITIAQKQLRNTINADGTINNKKLNKAAARGGETGFHVGGFALGFLLGWVGLIIAYLIKDDFKRNRVKWAWIGFGVSILFAVIVVLASI